MELKTVTITNVSRKQRTSKAGKPFTSLGLKTVEYGDKWLSGFDNAATKNWKEGDKVEIEIEQKGEYLNFSVPKGTDHGPAANNAGISEIKNYLMLRIEPMLKEIHKEQIAISERLEKALSDEPAKEEFQMPNFGEDDVADSSPF